MKKLLTIVVMSLLLTGCSSLIPKPVEFFQKKVKVFPEPTAKQEELQREAAQRAKESAQATLKAAVAEDSSTNLVAKATDTAVLSDSVATSLGPPVSPSVAPAAELATKLNTQVAKLNKKVEKFAEANEKLEGKKVEGTGALSVPYFLYVGLIALVVIVGWHLAKLALTAAAAANPGALVGVAGMNVAGSVISKGFHQLVSGGQAFKRWVDKEVSDPILKQKVLDAFTALHKQAQDEDVKNIVNKLNEPPV